MADRVTLAELQAVADPLVVTDDFTSLANRAVKRLYKKAATPGDTEVYHFPETPPSLANHGAGAGGVDWPSYMVMLPEEYSHALRFKIMLNVEDDHFYKKFMATENLDVVPLNSLFQNAGYDTTAFVDYGNVGTTGRLYAIPFEYWGKFERGDLDNTNVFALARRAYVAVVEDDDTFPFDSLDALKLAILATVYEDDNDVERATLYWQRSIAELDAESIEYRGPQQLYITYYDPASEEVTSTIN